MKTEDLVRYGLTMGQSQVETGAPTSGRVMLSLANRLKLVMVEVEKLRRSAPTAAHVGEYLEKKHEGGCKIGCPACEIDRMLRAVAALDDKD